MNRADADGNLLSHMESRITQKHMIPERLFAECRLFSHGMSLDCKDVVNAETGINISFWRGKKAERIYERAKPDFLHL